MAKYPGSSSRMLKKPASGVLSSLSCSRTAVYAPRAPEPAALLDLGPLEPLRAGERAFLTILPVIYFPGSRGYILSFLGQQLKVIQKI